MYLVKMGNIFTSSIHRSDKLSSNHVLYNMVDLTSYLQPSLIEIISLRITPNKNNQLGMVRLDHQSAIVYRIPIITNSDVLHHQFTY